MCGEGRFTDDTLQTFGGYGVTEIPEFQKLLQFICQRGFEHHVAATRATVAAAIHDALGTYLALGRLPPSVAARAFGSFEPPRHTGVTNPGIRKTNLT